VILLTDLVQRWVQENQKTLYKQLTTPISTILHRFKTIAQGVVEQAYDLSPSIWDNHTTDADYKKSKIAQLINDDSLKFLYGLPDSDTVVRAQCTILSNS